MSNNNLHGQQQYTPTIGRYSDKWQQQWDITRGNKKTGTRDTNKEQQENGTITTRDIDNN